MDYDTMLHQGASEHYTQTETNEGLRCDACGGFHLDEHMIYVREIKVSVCPECITGMTIEKATEYWPFADLDKLSEELNLLP